MKKAEAVGKDYAEQAAAIISEGESGKLDSATMVADLEKEMEKRAEESKKEEAAMPRPAGSTPSPQPPGSQPQALAAQVGKACPFVPAEKIDKRPKILLWGGSGSGKTTLALQFPKPVVIDMERGTDLYGVAGGFHVVHTQDPDKVLELINWLKVNRHDFRTLVLDSITIYYEALQSKWNDIYFRRNKQSKGFKFEYYDFQPKDWMAIRDEFQETIRALMGLDMTVVITAHSKAEYAEGEFMKKIGETFDSHKKTPFLFDYIFQLTHKDNRYMTTVVKQRVPLGAPRLPEKFETSYEPISQIFSGIIEKPAVPFEPPDKKAVEELRALCKEFGLSDAQAAARFETYGSQDPAELSAENVKLISEKLRSAIAAKRTKA